MKKFIAICLLLGGFALVSCTFSPKNMEKKRPHVVVSIPPYIAIVKAIAGETVDVQSVVPVNFDPHNMEATPKQRALVQQADLFICIGEPFEDKIIPVLEDHMRVLQLNEKIPSLSYSRDTHFVDSCSDSLLHVEGAQDVHFWLSPKRLPQQAMVIADALTDLKPDEESTYSKNSEDFIEKTRILDQKIQKMLLPYQRHAVLVPHSALGYFCFDYNLIQIAVECEGKSPLAHDMTHIIELAKHSETVCAFTFPQFNNKGVEFIAEKLKIPTYSVNPEGEDVLETIEKIATAIAQ